MLNPNLDPENLLAKTENFPHLFQQGYLNAKQYASKLPSIKTQAISNIIVAGMGGSAIAADVLKNLLEPKLAIPFIVHRSYGLPEFVNAKSLVILSSYSGNTEETLSALEAAKKKHAQVVALTSGGLLAKDCPNFIPLESGYQPRIAFPFAFASLLALLERYELAADLPQMVTSTATFLTQLTINHWSSSIPEELNLAKQLASFCIGSLVLIISSPTLTGCAFRFKAQLNENAKHPAYNQEIPELNHNEILGWEAAAAIPKPVAVMFSDAEDHPRIKARFNFTQQLFEEQGINTRFIAGEGPNQLARVLNLILLGDLTSIFLAYQKKINPAEIESIKKIKAFLANL
jgi:glucose/mannose-6-phosphate isomerase